MARCYKTVLLLFCLTSVWFSVESMTLTQSLRSLLNHFTKTRNVAVNPATKQNARDLIIKTFKDHGLYTWTEEFASNNAQYPGMNIIGQLSGRYTGSRDDKIVLIGSHYDSEDTTPGVNDNGSGMTALLQALKLYTSPDKLNCTRDYTLLFVAFDLEETQPTCPAQINCSCESFVCGSNYFVQNFTRYLNSSGAGFQGAFIFDTILNHDTTPNSQVFPQGLQSVFPQLFQNISDNDFKGDFLAVIGRMANDDELMNELTNAFKSDATFKSLAVKIPSLWVGRPQNWPLQVQSGLFDLFRSDHYEFWNADPSLPAVFLTDTADFRGYMKRCYHQSCDDINHVTADMLTFLGRTTESIVKVASKMTNETCEMKKTANCVQEATGDKGIITTPYYGSEYPNNIDCTWTVTVTSPEHKRVHLVFDTFDLEESEDCSADYVEIRDGNEKTARLIERFCGKQSPHQIEGSTLSLYIRFHSDELSAFKGFKAEWRGGAKGYHQGMWQLIGVLVMTTLAFGL